MKLILPDHIIADKREKERKEAEHHAWLADRDYRKIYNRHVARYLKGKRVVCKVCGVQAGVRIEGRGVTLKDGRCQLCQT